MEERKREKKEDSSWDLTSLKKRANIMSHQTTDNFLRTQGLENKRRDTVIVIAFCSVAAVFNFFTLSPAEVVPRRNSACVRNGGQILPEVLLDQDSFTFREPAIPANQAFFFVTNTSFFDIIPTGIDHFRHSCMASENNEISSNIFIGREACALQMFLELWKEPSLGYEVGEAKHPGTAVSPTRQLSPDFCEAEGCRCRAVNINIITTTFVLRRLPLCPSGIEVKRRENGITDKRAGALGVDDRMPRCRKESLLLQLVNGTPVQDEESLQVRILEGCETKRHSPGIGYISASEIECDDVLVQKKKKKKKKKNYHLPTSLGLHYQLSSTFSTFRHIAEKTILQDSKRCAVSSTQKFLVQQHITTSKHQANKQLNSKQRQLFLTQPTTSNEFLEKYTQHTIPDESTLRKTYAPSIYDETIQKIRDEIKDSSIWVSIDETPDKEGRLVGNVVIGLLSEQYSERILLHCDVLEKCNNKTIVKLFNEAMGILWPKGIMYDNVLFFISDAAPYMVKAGQALSVVYPKLTHFTCVAHAFHPPSRVNVLKEMYPEIPLPPKPILTRWGTWLEAVEYYAEHIDSINNVLLALDSEDAVSIDTAKTVTCDISVKNDLAHIQHTFSCIIKTLKSLQNRHLSLSESFEIINSTVEQLNRGRGKVADAVRAKVDTVLSKTLDMKNYKRLLL
ncbi:hypothetical protein ANN_22526 [Periplaneta americana]|uniref:DUF659 domain-containing protein n=1 Tax=Periplaneta americana TaxID=6978 RepID=A0ABQ8S8Q0_PERAM|nr:hypothetical protein ANN_22526 [Periplaneta americana]